MAVLSSEAGRVLTLHRIDTLARLSVYTVPSSAPSYTSLLPHFLPPRPCLPHTLVVIVLDWTKPWTFVEELEAWLQWVEAWAKGDGSRELEITREENRERCTRFSSLSGSANSPSYQYNHTYSTMPSHRPIRCQQPPQRFQVPYSRWVRER